MRSRGIWNGVHSASWEQLGSYKTEIIGRGNWLRWPRNTLYQQRLALTSPTSGGRSVGTVRLRTTATEFSLVLMVAKPLYSWQIRNTEFDCNCPLFPTLQNAAAAHDKRICYRNVPKIEK
jgi:hypothetical protein